VECVESRDAPAPPISPAVSWRRRGGALATPHLLLASGLDR
jgi:hypothetical protein